MKLYRLDYQFIGTGLDNLDQILDEDAIYIYEDSQEEAIASGDKFSDVAVQKGEAMAGIKAKAVMKVITELPKGCVLAMVGAELYPAEQKPLVTLVGPGNESLN